MFEKIIERYNLKSTFTGKTEVYLFILLMLLAIPGLVNITWLYNFQKDMIIEDFEESSYVVANFFTKVYQTTADYQTILKEFPKVRDLENIYIYEEELEYRLTVKGDIFTKDVLEKLWHKGLDLDENIYVIKKETKKDNRTKEIYFVFKINDLTRKIKEYEKIILIRSLFIFSIFLVLFFYIMLTIIKPIKKLLNETKYITDGDYSYKITTNFNFNEINEIASQINKIIEKLELKEQKVMTEIRSIVDYLTSKAEELEYAKINAENANRYKTEFLANVSHEIRTPLNAIIGFTEQLIAKETDETKLYYLRLIVNSGRILILLVNDILDISKIEAGKLELSYTPTNIQTILQEVSDLYTTRAIAKNLLFITNHDPNIPSTILIDDLRFRQILINLVSNAIKFTDKGSITLSTKLLKINPATKKVDFSITVKDTGIGVNKEYQKKIFEPFTQQEGQSFRKYGGTGLGLPITKKLVELMGGKIELISEENKGSEFIVTLMDINFVESEQDQITEEYVDFNFDLAKVLIYNQNPDNKTETELLSELISHKKLIVYNVNNIEDLKKYFDNYQIDVLIYCCDIIDKNKVNSAKEVFEEAKKINVPIIRISSFNEENLKFSDTTLNFDEVITKPVKKSKLYETISKLKKKQGAAVETNNGKEVDLIEQYISSCPTEIRNKIIEQFSFRADDIQKKLILSQVKEFVEDFCKFASEINHNSVEQICTHLKNNLAKYQLSEVKNILKSLANIKQN